MSTEKDIVNEATEHNENEVVEVIERPIAEYEEAEDAQLLPPDQPKPPVDDDRYIRFGGIFLAATLGVFSLWAGFAPLGSAVVGAGEVVVNSYRKSIQHFEGGVVQKIYVRNGDIVAAGDPLIQLKTTQSGAQQDSNKKRLYTAQAELERLIAEQAFSNELNYSEELREKAKHDRDIQEALAQQKQLHEARLSAYNQEQEALESRVGQIRQQISGLSNQRNITLETIASLEDEQKAHSTLFEEGLGDGLRARELSRTVLSNKNEVASIESEISRLKIQITETDLQIATRKQDYLKDVGERIKQTQDNYYAFKEGLQVAVDRVERSTIRAPEAGIVVDMKIHTIGSVAPAGQTLLDLVPEHDSYVVETKLMPQDINEVYPGQLADIRFSAFSAKTTKIIEGEVINISADRLINQQDGSAYYLARIRVTDEGSADLSPNKLKPGMPAEVMIVRAERTLFSYLLKPLSDSFARSLKEK